MTDETTGQMRKIRRSVSRARRLEVTALAEAVPAGAVTLPDREAAVEAYRVADTGGGVRFRKVEGRGS
jgi:hypothetical protein